MAHLLHSIDNVYHYGCGPDLLLFHGFPISDWDLWSRDEALERCVRWDGPELGEIAAKARQYGATWRSAPT